MKRQQLPGWAILMPTIAVALITAASMYQLNQWADQSNRAEVLLASTAERLSQLSALEWEAIAKKEIDRESLEEIGEIRNEVANKVQELQQLEPKSSGLKQFLNLYEQYNRALDKQLQLIVAKQIEQAIEIDQQEVDPTYERLCGEIKGLGENYQARSRQARQTSDIGTTISLLVAASLIGGLSWRFSGKFLAQTKALNRAFTELKEAQSQLVQAEKMSSLGQMIAGIAHEVNNPVSFIQGNLQHAKQYTQDLQNLVQLYEKHYPNPNSEIQDKITEIELDFLNEDLTKLLNSMEVGADRINEIVTSLRNFSRLDESDFKAVDIHEGLDSTLMILQNRLKAQPKRACIEVVKRYGQLPAVECYAGQLNQVFMNLLSNAIDSLEARLERNQFPPPSIQVRTGIRDDRVFVRISDNGSGVNEKLQNKIFDPFFTTKPIGKGTGLGLSISYQIVTEKHGGKLYCHSDLRQGAEFVIEIPIRQQR